MDQRTAVERLTWRPDNYGNPSTISAVEAIYDGRSIAYIATCPLGRLSHHAMRVAQMIYCASNPL